MAIQDGSKFGSPVDLVKYHMRHVDGLLTTLKVPCKRLQGTPPQGYRFVTHEEMQTAMRQAALQLGYQVRGEKDMEWEGGEGGGSGVDLVAWFLLFLYFRVVNPHPGEMGLFVSLKCSSLNKIVFGENLLPQLLR